MTEPWADCAPTPSTPSAKYTKTYTGLDQGDYVFSARAMDAIGRVSFPVTESWTVAAPADTEPPVVTVTPEGTPGSTATFNLTATDDVSVTFLFECQLTKNGQVAQDWADCTSTPSTPSATGTKTYPALDQGDYVFSARATDAAGKVSLPDTESWTVAAPADTEPPVVTVTPEGTPGSTATFNLTATDNVSVTFLFECQLTKNGQVAQDWADCTSTPSTPSATGTKTYPALDQGDYVFSARATDAAGKVSLPDTESWTVAAPADTEPPVVTVTPEGTPGSTATFNLTATDNVSVTFLFECQLTKNGQVAQDWADCASTPSTPSATGTKTYPALDQGDYVFSARATDAAGKVSAEDTESWTVAPPADTTPPVVTVTPVGTPGATATFTLEATDNVSVTFLFECKLTKNTAVTEDWVDCASTPSTPSATYKTYTGLLPGDYVFSARATDAAGNVSLRSTTSWTVAPPADTTPPVVTVTPVGTPGSTATFTLKATDNVSVTFQFECQLTKNGKVTEAWAVCTSTKTYTGLKPATYVFSARTKDAAGNPSNVATASWTVKKVSGR